MPNTTAVVGRFFNFRLDVNLIMQGNFHNYLKLIQEVVKCDEHIKPIHHAIVLLYVLPSHISRVKAVLQYSGVEPV